MLEFARSNWLWLFALVALFYLAWWFARRYRTRRVTYGRIWERVAKRVLPPAWKRVLRTVLTLLIAGLMLGSIVLYAAGLQRPQAEQPAPLMIAIVLDNSPSMRAQTRAKDAQARARQLIDALGEHDRAVLVWSRDSRWMVGPWLKRGDEPGDPPPTDLTPADRRDLAERLAALQAPPGVPDTPAPVLAAVHLTDDGRGDALADAPARLAGHDWTGRFGVPTYVETFGNDADNRYIAAAEYHPPAPGDSHGGLIAYRAEVRPGGEAAVEARLLDGTPLNASDGRVELPIRADPIEARLSVREDALPQDNAVGMSLNPHRLARVTLCYPAEDGEANPLLLRTLSEFLPGREVEPRAVPGDGPVRADLLVCDRVLPEDFDARFVLCFGVLPEGYGAVSDSVEAQPGMQLRDDRARDVQFEVPELTLLHARRARPLAPGHSLTPLVRHIEGGTLIGVGPDLLYSGFVPHESTLLLDTSGFLLLYRWLHSLQAGARVDFPPFVPWDKPTEFELSEPATLQIRLLHSPWLPCFGPRDYTVTTGPDGRGEIGPFAIPGEYVVERDGREAARFTAIWHDGAEQTLAVTPRPPLDLAALFRQAREPDWRDHLPGALLWIALALLVFEWVLWLAGVTE